jgi:hypothetical protein
MDERHFDGGKALHVGTGATMRRVKRVPKFGPADHHGDIIPRVGDVVMLRAVGGDPGTVIKILQVNATYATVAVKWFVWDNGRTTEEYVSELRIVSEV